MKNLLKVLYIILLTLGAYYVVTRAFTMMIPSQESYGDRYFAISYILLPHITLGIIAILIGPFQFIPSLRNGNIRRHRFLGKLYLISVIVGGVLGMYLSVVVSSDIGYMFAILAMSFFWTSTGIMAYLAVRKKKIEQHKEWMMRSYTLTFFGFVFTRLIIDTLVPLEIATPTVIINLAVWSSWLIPLLILETILQGKKIYTP